MSDNGVNNDKKQKLREKSYGGGGKEKVRQYYLKYQNVIKEKARTMYQNLSKEQKQAKRDYSKKRYKQMIKQSKNQKILKIIFQ